MYLLMSIHHLILTIDTKHYNYDITIDTFTYDGHLYFRRSPLLTKGKAWDVIITCSINQLLRRTKSGQAMAGPARPSEPPVT